MRALILIYLVTTIALTGKAQTKEEAEKFIAKYMNEAVGIRTYSTSSDGKKTEEYQFEKNEFSLTGINIKQAAKDYERGTYNQTFTITNLLWENVKTIKLDTFPSECRGNDAARIILFFSTKVKIMYSSESGTYDNSDNNIFYEDLIEIIVPQRRAVACEKAFRHIVALYKADNKDPFEH